MQESLIGAVLLSVSVAQPGSAPKKPDRPLDRDASPPVVSIKQTDPVDAVFIEHVGPYWTVGSTATRVRDHMQAHHEPGPMFIRYFQNPTRGAAWRRSKVGFIVHGDHPVEPPFQRARWPGELVASMVVQGRNPAPWHAYRLIRARSHDLGYETTGRVTEFFDPRFSGSAAGAPTTEIQAPVRAEKPAGKQASRPGPAAAPHDDEEGKSLRAAPQEASRLPVVDDHREVVDGGPGQPAAPITALVTAGRFEAVAEQLMPEDAAWPSTLQIWLGQVVFRVEAAARGIQQVYPDQGEVAMAIADALTRRYKRMSAGFALSPLTSAVVRVGPDDQPTAKQARAIMNDLDSLLGRIALHTLGEGKTPVSALAAVLQRVRNLLRDERIAEPAEK